MKLAGLLSKELIPALATLLARTAAGDVAGTVVGGLAKVAERLAIDYYDQQELIRNFQRVAEKLVQRLEPRLKAAVAAGGVDLEKVAGGLAALLARDASAPQLFEHRLSPDRLAEAWRAARFDRWNDFNSAERALYDATLDDAARYLVEVAAKLPGFQTAFAARVVQELAAVVDDVDRLFGRVDEVGRLVERLGATGDVAQYEADYRRAVLRKFDYMELLGADLPSESRQHPLSVAYVSLTVLPTTDDDDERGVACGFEALLDELSQTRSEPPGTEVSSAAAASPIEQAATEEKDSRRPPRRLLVRGEAGSGKSTLFRWAALQAAAPGITGSGVVFGEASSPTEKTLPEKDSRPPWRRCLPFLIRLRDYPQGRLPSVLDLPREVAKNVGTPPEAWVKKLFATGQALLLFDGVDEVPNDRRDDVRREIESIIEQYPGNFYLVSTRPSAVPEGWLSRQGFREAEINPMSGEDQAQFIAKWHEAVAEQLRRDRRLTEQEDLPALARRLADKLRQNPPMARLATNPLLCGMICALHRKRQEQLPETQARLCEDLCEILLHRRERESLKDAVKPSPLYDRLNPEQKRAVVQELAHFMVRNGQSSVSAEEADRCVETALSRFPAGLVESATAVREALVERSGLLRESQPGRLDFIHNTLKEYLAGDRFAQLGDVGQLVEHALDPAWQPTILFAAGSRIVGFADRLVERLLASAESPLARTVASVKSWLGGTDTVRARKLFAVRCGEALHLSAANRQRLKTVLAGTNRPLSVAESEAFAALGDFVVPYLKSESDLPARTAVACVRTLRLIGSEAARECLKTYCGERRPTVLAELKQAVDPLDLAVVQEEVLSLIKSDSLVTQRLKTEPVGDVLRGVDCLDIESGVAWDATPLEQLPNLRQVTLSGHVPTALDTLARFQIRIRKGCLASNSFGMSLALIPAGEFLMGADEYGDEKPRHRVRITQSFLLGVYPVTQQEYERVVGQNPSHFKNNPQAPVERVSWFDAVGFCNRLSELEGRKPYYILRGETVAVAGGDGYRLPTEAEWEYACRAGSTGRWCFGDNESDLADYAWYRANSDRQTHPVGQKKPNPWGLYDMHGNVWEWCADWYDDSYYHRSPDCDPTGPDTGSARVLRGGCWDVNPDWLRSAYRDRSHASYADLGAGVRVARALRKS